MTQEDVTAQGEPKSGVKNAASSGLRQILPEIERSDQARCEKTGVLKNSGNMSNPFYLAQPTSRRHKLKVPIAAILFISAGWANTIAPEHSLPGNLYRMAGNIRLKSKR